VAVYCLLLSCNIVSLLVRHLFHCFDGCLKFNKLPYVLTSRLFHNAVGHKIKPLTHYKNTALEKYAYVHCSVLEL